MMMLLSDWGKLLFNAVVFFCIGLLIDCEPNCDFKDYCTDHEYISISVNFMEQCSTIMWIPKLLPLLWESNFSLSSLPDLRVEDSPKAHYVYHPPSPALRANQTNCWTVYCVTYAKTTSSRFPLVETTRSKSVCVQFCGFSCLCMCVQNRDREIRYI